MFRRMPLVFLFDRLVGRRDIQDEDRWSQALVVAGADTTVLQGATLGENAHALVRSCVSRPLSSTRNSLINLILLVDRCRFTLRVID